MTSEPESLILHLLRDMRADVADMRTEVRGEVGNLREKMATREDVISLRADVASDLLLMRKEFNEQIAGLRRAVMEYHTTVIGHGVLISDLEARLRRIEQHLDLPALGSH